jgi:hypothetical protein
VPLLSGLDVGSAPSLSLLTGSPQSLHCFSWVSLKRCTEERHKGQALKTPITVTRETGEWH